MKIEIDEKNVDAVGLPLAASKVVLVPRNWSETDALPHYSSTSLSFYKYAAASVPIEFRETPDALIEQRSGDWFAPTMLITKALIEEHPLIFSVLTGLFTNYLSDFFKGQTKPKANVDLIIETKDGEKSKLVRLNARVTTEELEIVMKHAKEIANGK